MNPSDMDVSRRHRANWNPNRYRFRGPGAKAFTEHGFCKNNQHAPSLPICPVFNLQSFCDGSCGDRRMVSTPLLFVSLELILSRRHRRIIHAAFHKPTQSSQILICLLESGVLYCISGVSRQAVRCVAADGFFRSSYSFLLSYESHITRWGISTIQSMFKLRYIPCYL